MKGRKGRTDQPGDLRQRVEVRDDLGNRGRDDELIQGKEEDGEHHRGKEHDEPGLKKDGRKAGKVRLEARSRNEWRRKANLAHGNDRPSSWTSRRTSTDGRSSRLSRSGSSSRDLDVGVRLLLGLEVVLELGVVRRGRERRVLGRVATEFGGGRHGFFVDCLAARRRGGWKGGR